MSVSMPCSEYIFIRIAPSSQFQEGLRALHLCPGISQTLLSDGRAAVPGLTRVPYLLASCMIRTLPGPNVNRMPWYPSESRPGFGASFNKSPYTNVPALSTALRHSSSISFIDWGSISSSSSSSSSSRPRHCPHLRLHVPTPCSY